MRIGKKIIEIEFPEKEVAIPVRFPIVKPEERPIPVIIPGIPVYIPERVGAPNQK